jgi:hypothetical protein
MNKGPACTRSGVAAKPASAILPGAPLIVAAWLLCIVWIAIATDAFAGNAGRPLFQSDATLTVTLQAPWLDLLKKTNDQRRHAAVIGYNDAQGNAQRIEATIETRGLTRLRFCRFPPLRIRFAKAATQGTVFEGQRSLKLVTHCRNGQQFAQYYVQEMLAYRIYNLLTDVSFRVRPLDITYIDSRGGKANGPRFAFLIEDTDDMARRNGLKRDRAAKFAIGDLDALALSRLMIFQYLIGNTDFAVLSGPREDACCHNTRVVGSGDPQARIAVPYDFDSAGMVAADYVAPHESLPIKRVSERLYRGFCRHNHTLAAAREEFLAQRTAIFELIEDEPRLNAKRRRELTRYIEEFYATLNSEYGFQREIGAKCRK